LSNVTDILTLVVGSGGALTALGAAGKFVWDKIERRFVGIEEQLDECRQRERESHERRAIQLTVIELLWLKIKEFDPTAPVLLRAKHLLDDLRKKSGDAPD
jgi:chromosome condensin MukBEF ATPase and DNA-binding subunit MukB